MANLNNYYNLPPILRDYLINLQTIQGKSPRTVHEYYLDLRNFFRFIFQYKNLCPANQKFNTISLDPLNIDIIREITLNDVYAYLNFLAQERPIQPNSPHSAIGLSAKSRARKVSALRTYFKYLTEKVHLLEINPITQLDLPKYKKEAVPKYLSVDSAEELLEHVDGTFKERDYCILVFFLNCGLRVSELVGLNLDDIRDRYIRILGKGNKERVLYLNESCIEALNAYLPKRLTPCAADAKALFVSRNSRRINVQTVKWLVKKHLKAAGLSDKGYSAHKLRHTAATLMYQNGVDIRTLQEVLGHDNVNTTMIYTHTADENLKKALSQNPLANLKKKSEPKEE